MSQLLPPKGIMCHRTGFEKSCFDCVTQHGCQLWINVVGTHPQTGADVNRYACADSWMPLLTIENSQQQRQTAAAVESFRNAVVSGGHPALEVPFRALAHHDKSG